MHQKIKLHSFRRCPFAIRVRMVLHEKEIPFETIEEDLKNFSPELIKLHPEAKVPLLVDGDIVVYESSIITEYLEDRYPGKIKLMPESAYERMLVRQWTYWCNHIFKPVIDRFKYKQSEMNDSEKEEAAAKLSEHLKQLEEQLEKSPWLVGNQFSLADIHVFPFLRQVSLITPQDPLKPLSGKTQKWQELIGTRHSFVKTMMKL